MLFNEYKIKKVISILYVILLINLLLKTGIGLQQMNNYND